MNDTDEEFTTTYYYYNPCWYNYCDENGTVLSYPFYWCCGSDCNANCTLSGSKCEDACWKTYRDTYQKKWTNVPGEGVQSYMTILGIIAILALALLVYILYHVMYHFGWCPPCCYNNWPVIKYQYCSFCNAFMDFDSETVLSGELSSKVSSKKGTMQTPKSEAVVHSGTEPSVLELEPTSQSEKYQVKDVIKAKSEELGKVAFANYIIKLSKPRGETIPKVMKIFSFSVLFLFSLSIASHIFQVFGLLDMYDNGPLCESYIGPGENLDWICYDDGSRWSKKRSSLSHGWRLQFTCWFLGKAFLYLLIAYRMYQTFRPSVYRFSEIRVKLPAWIKGCLQQCCHYMAPDQLALPKVGIIFFIVVFFQTIITVYWGVNPKPVTKGNDQSWIAWLALSMDIVISITLLLTFMYKLNQLIISSAQSGMSDAVLVEAKSMSEKRTKLGSLSSETKPAALQRTLTMEIDHHSKQSAKQSQKLINVATKQLVLALVVLTTGSIVMTFRAIVSETDIENFDDYTYVYESMFVAVALDCFVNSLGVWLIFKFSADSYNYLCFLCDKFVSKICFAVVWHQIDRDMRLRASIASKQTSVN